MSKEQDKDELQEWTESRLNALVESPKDERQIILTWKDLALAAAIAGAFYYLLAD